MAFALYRSNDMLAPGFRQGPKPKRLAVAGFRLATAPDRWISLSDIGLTVLIAAATLVILVSLDVYF
jgi:hypothetical protein